MRIGLISDTHIPTAGKEPPPQVARAFAGVDLILHAGDIYISSCIEWLERIAPVKASITSLDSTKEGASRSNPVQVVEVEGHAIGIVHELLLSGMDDEALPGAIAARFPAGKSIPQALEKIFGQPVDIVVTGMTHQAMVELHQGVLVINPGSPTMVKQTPKLGTVAVLNLTPESRAATIIELAHYSE